ncbi:MAG: helix-turn-helix domain-containing protein [Egibacteraceae bacterium]
MAARPARRLLGRSEATYLSALGAAARAAPKRERPRARQEVVRAAEARRLDGVSQLILAQAIGVSPQTLRRWRREAHDSKPPTPALVLALGSARFGLRYEAPESQASLPRSEFQSISASSSQNEHIDAFGVSVGLWSLPDARELRIMLPAEPSRPKGGVLFLAGHPQGGFRFDQEAADVRRLVWPTSVPFDCAPCVALAEVAHLIDEHGPRLLHVSAHAVFGGCWLSHGDSPTAVTGLPSLSAQKIRGFRKCLTTFC